MVPGSAAHKAGLKVHDTVLSIDGEMVFSIKALKKQAAGRNRLEIIVNRLMEAKAGGSFRQANVVDMTVQLDPQGMGGVGLGARIVEVTSGLGTSQSVPFLMVCALNPYNDGSPGPSMLAGVKQYDLVLMVDGKKVNALKELVVALRGKASTVFTVRRLAFEFGGQSLFKKNSKGLKSKTLMVQREAGRGLGVSLNEAYRNGEAEPFVVVTAVRAGTAAEDAGLLEEDLIIRVDGVDIYSIDDVRTAMQGKTQFRVEVERFGLAEESAGINQTNFWDKVDNLFDKIDHASSNSKDDSLGMADLRAYFGDDELVKSYLNDMDGYSNGNETATDGQISREEWYEYFDYIAKEDTGVAETSPSAYAALRELSAAK